MEDEILKANKILEQKRVEIQKKQENTLEKLKSCITTKDFTKAREKAESLKDTSVWPEVVELFKKSQDEICSICGKPNKTYVDTKTLDVSAFCPACREEEYVEKQKLMRKQTKDKVAINIRNILLRRKVPRIFIEARLNDFGKDYQRFKNYTPSLYLYGPPGRGKTYLAVALMCEFILSMEPIEKGFSFEIPEYNMPLFVSVPDLLLQIRDTFGSNRSGMSEKQIVDYFTEIPYLVMDDIGAEKTSEWSIATFYTIIDRRSRNRLKTIFTSNLSLDILAKKLDDRIASRIIGMCKKNFEIKGRDRRLD